MNFLAIFQRLRQMVVDVWQRTEKRDRNRFFVISGVSLVVVVAALILLNRTPYVQLSPGSMLDDATRAEITTVLTSQGIPSKIDTDGSILVPEKSRVAATNYLSVNGIPNSTKLNTDIYALGTGLTANSAQQEQYRVYQQQEYIRTSLRNTNNVRDAIVLLAVPQDKLTILSANKPKTTASVHLITEDGDTPSRNLVEAAKAITAAAVPGLEKDNVAVTCQNGILLGDVDDAYGQLYLDRLELVNRYEGDMELGTFSLLDSVLGRDNYNAKANVTLDFDTEITDTTEYYPSVEDSGMVESMQTVAEIAQGYGVAVGEPGIDDNGGGDGYDEVETDPSSYYEKNSNIVNYAINERRQHIEKELGKIKEQTFSIIINSNKIPEESKLTAAIKSIIGGAIGLTSDKYNLISVAYQPFTGLEEDQAAHEAWLAEQRRAELMALIRIIVLYLVIGVCVVLLILKTYGLLKKEPTEEELLADAIAEGYDPDMDEVAALVEMATLGEITEAPKSPFREQIEKFIDKNPTAVADLLRNWLNEEFN